MTSKRNWVPNIFPDALRDPYEVYQRTKVLNEHPEEVADIAQMVNRICAILEKSND